MEKLLPQTCIDRVRVARFPRWRRWPAAIAVLLLACSSYGNPPEPSPSTSPSSASTPARKVEPPSKPVPAHRAPDGVLYLVEDVMVPFEHGLQGLAAGTEVKLVKENGDAVQVATDDSQFTVKKIQVTDDLDVVAAVRKRAAAIEAANEASQRLQEAALIKQQHDEMEFLRTHPLATPTPTPKPKK